MWKKEQGSATIEATVSLSIFIFLFAAIYSIISFCVIQQKVSYAIDSAAKQIAEYSYFYHFMGLDEKEDGLKESAKNSAEAFSSLNKNISGIHDSFQTGADGVASGDYGAIIEAIKQGTANTQELGNMIQTVVDDPGKFISELFAQFAVEGLEKAKVNLIMEPLARSFVSSQFGHNYGEADRVLKSLGVKKGMEGLDFQGSRLFTSAEGITDDDVYINVTYTLELDILGPFKKEVEMSHTAHTRAWLGGDGE